MDRKVNEFVVTLKSIFPLLEEFKSYIRMMDSQRLNQINAYSKFADFLCKYEERMFEAFAPTATESVAIFGVDAGDSSKANLKVELNNLAERITNPYKRFRYWI